LPETARIRSGEHRIVQFILTYVFARAIGWALGFRYNLFTDDLDIPRLFADLALWVGLWVGFGMVLRRISRGTPRGGA
jgi:hypothetical protein